MPAHVRIPARGSIAVIAEMIAEPLAGNVIDVVCRATRLRIVSCFPLISVLIHRVLV